MVKRLPSDQNVQGSSHNFENSYIIISIISIIIVPDLATMCCDGYTWQCVSPPSSYWCVHSASQSDLLLLYVEVSSDLFVSYQNLSQGLWQFTHCLVQINLATVVYAE